MGAHLASDWGKVAPGTLCLSPLLTPVQPSKAIVGILYRTWPGQREG